MIELGYSQNPKEFTNYSESVILDTTLQPDFYKVEITISQHYKTIGKGRKSYDYIVPLDTVKSNLLVELRKLGVHQMPTLTRIFDQEEYNHRRERLLQASYELYIYSKDTVMNLYHGLISKFETNVLKRVFISPGISKQILLEARAKLETIALEKAKKNAQKFGDSNNVSIIKIDNYQVDFREKKPYINYVQNQTMKSFNIDCSNPEYTLTVYYIFSLK